MSNCRENERQTDILDIICISGKEVTSIMYFFIRRHHLWSEGFIPVGSYWHPNLQCKYVMCITCLSGPINKMYLWQTGVWPIYVFLFPNIFYSMSLEMFVCLFVFYPRRQALVLSDSRCNHMVL